MNILLSTSTLRQRQCFSLVLAAPERASELSRTRPVFRHAAAAQALWRVNCIFDGTIHQQLGVRGLELRHT